ncbi:MAG: hypothetical protein ACFFAS_10235 [Promethearchaeota archaeon]
MSDQRLNHQDEILKKESQKEFVEARLQYEKVYLELKRKILGSKNHQLKSVIEEHNKKVVEYYHNLLKERNNEAKQTGIQFTNQDHQRLVKELWKRMYVFE